MFFKTFLFYLIIVNVYAFVIMHYDKSCAQKGKTRVPEKTLFSISFFGGSLGMYIGMYTFRHKTLHMSFVIGIPLLFLLNLVFIYILFNFGIFYY